MSKQGEVKEKKRRVTMGVHEGRRKISVCVSQCLPQYWEPRVTESLGAGQRMEGKECACLSGCEREKGCGCGKRPTENEIASKSVLL